MKITNPNLKFGLTSEEKMDMAPKVHNNRELTTIFMQHQMQVLNPDAEAKPLIFKVETHLVEILPNEDNTEKLQTELKFCEMVLEYPELFRQGIEFFEVIGNPKSTLEAVVERADYLASEIEGKPIEAVMEVISHSKISETDIFDKPWGQILEAALTEKPININKSQIGILVIMNLLEALFETGKLREATGTFACEFERQKWTQGKDDPVYPGSSGDFKNGIEYFAEFVNNSLKMHWQKTCEDVSEDSGVEHWNSALEDMDSINPDPSESNMDQDDDWAAAIREEASKQPKDNLEQMGDDWAAAMDSEITPLSNSRVNKLMERVGRSLGLDGDKEGDSTDEIGQILDEVGKPTNAEENSSTAEDEWVAALSPQEDDEQSNSSDNSGGQSE